MLSQTVNVVHTWTWSLYGLTMEYSQQLLPLFYNFQSTWMTLRWTQQPIFQPLHWLLKQQHGYPLNQVRRTQGVNWLAVVPYPALQNHWSRTLNINHQLNKMSPIGAHFQMILMGGLASLQPSYSDSMFYFDKTKPLKWGFKSIHSVKNSLLRISDWDLILTFN